MLQAVERPVVLTQDAYIGRGPGAADVRVEKDPDLGIDTTEDLMLPPERIPPMPLLPLQREPSKDAIFMAIGRRKTSSATAMLIPVLAEEQATIIVNNKELPDYFPSYRGRDLVLDPLLLTERLGQFRAVIRVTGGGFMCTLFAFVCFSHGSGGGAAQAGAARLAIARALQKYDPELRFALKTAGFLLRDPRMVERKKPGKAKARKSFTWHKR